MANSSVSNLANSRRRPNLHGQRDAIVEWSFIREKALKVLLGEVGAELNLACRIQRDNAPTDERFERLHDRRESGGGRTFAFEHVWER